MPGVCPIGLKRVDGEPQAIYGIFEWLGRRLVLLY